MNYYDSVLSQLDKSPTEWGVMKARRVNLESVHFQDDFVMITVYIEQAICSHVMPEIFTDDVEPNLHDLLNLLNSVDHQYEVDPNEEKREKILCSAKMQWANVCEEFNFPEEWKMKSGEWKVADCTVPNDIRAIEVLKFGRVGIVNKTVRLKHAEQDVDSMMDKMPLWQFELVAGFIGLLRGKMIRSGLHHNNLLLD